MAEGADDTPPPSFFEWLEWAESQAYGPLGLKPWEFYRLTPMELNKLIEGYQVRREDRAFMTAWFVSNMINVHIKHPIQAKELAKPFLHEKTSSEIRRERDEFITSFRKQREEAGFDGDSDEYFGEDWGE